MAPPEKPGVLFALSVFLFGIGGVSIIFYGGYYYGDFIPAPEPNTTLATRLVYALRCSFPPLLVLIGYILKVGNARKNKGALNPLDGKEDRILCESKILANTLEQFVVYLVTSLVLSTFLDGQELRLVALYSAVFVLGRFLFRMGYPTKRSYGMFLNFASTFFICGVVIYLTFTRGIMFGLMMAEHGSVKMGSFEKQEL
jgi:hypothetical protein